MSRGGIALGLVLALWLVYMAAAICWERGYEAGYRDGWWSASSMR